MLKQILSKSTQYFFYHVKILLVLLFLDEKKNQSIKLKNIFIMLSLKNIIFPPKNHFPTKLLC